MDNKTYVFGVSHWDTKEEAKNVYDQICQWRHSIYYSGLDVSNIDDHMFLTTGTYSKPSLLYQHLLPDLMLYRLSVIQNGVQYTKPYDVTWNYFRNGFMTGIWHFLLNKRNCDILFHIQPRTLIRKNALDGLMNEFRESDALIMAPKLKYDYGVHVEVSFMAMKREAVMLYASSGLRSSLSLVPLGAFNCEAEAEHLFYDKWFNPWPDISSIRKYPMVRREDCEYNISDEEFIKLPFIATGWQHCDEKDVKLWRKHNV